MGSKSKSETIQQETNETNISTITDIRGGIGVTGQNAVDLVGVTSALAANLTSTTADVAKEQLRTASASTSALGDVTGKLTAALAKISGGGSESKTPNFLIIGGVVVAATLAFVFIRR